MTHYLRVKEREKRKSKPIFKDYYFEPSCTEKTTLLDRITKGKTKLRYVK